ncbi:sterol desaturase family protein [uncultured Roseovarius sp.]|uniref:sterol desaturase family protein n=1 Tax=uncultured Roseovarius sp. TaxID=293344 RepID=UPI0025CBD422|nr:sterol desaturase family protein [uncultured Roseovarius sp.]
MGLDWLQAVFSEIWTILAGPKTRLWPLYIGLTILICLFLYRRRGIEQGFFEWLMPKSIYFHASHIVDLKIFAVNRAFAALGLFNLVFFGAYVADFVSGALGPGLGLAPLSPFLISLLLLVVSDFGTYWVHRVHHESRIFWPFHSLHHSAEVMTPITVFRKHPVYDLISTMVKGLFIGCLQGIFLAVFSQDPNLMTIVGVNAGYFLFNMAGSNLRHTHVWLSFGRLIEHVIISPAQHQIHHSLAPEHHNKNYGEVLAIWDWMFGSLYVPEREEVLEFGLGDAEGNRIRQRHDSLTNALVVPMRDSWRQVRKRLGLSPKPAPRAEDVAPAQDVTPAE